MSKSSKFHVVGQYDFVKISLAYGTNKSYLVIFSVFSNEMATWVILMFKNIEK